MIYACKICGATFSRYQVLAGHVTGAHVKPMKGRSFSEEHKRKIGLAVAGLAQGNKYRLGKRHTEEAKAKMSERSKGHGIGNRHAAGHKWTPERHQAHADRMIGNRRLLSCGRLEDVKRQMSLSAVLRVQREGATGAVHKKYRRGAFHWRDSGVEIRYDSGLELMVLQMWSATRHITSVVRCPYAIGYEHNGARTYLPDFLVTYTCGMKEIVEVKAVWQLSVDQKTKAKILAGQQFAAANGLMFNVMTEKELR